MGDQGSTVGTIIVLYLKTHQIYRACSSNITRNLILTESLIAIFLNIQNNDLFYFKTFTI